MAVLANCACCRHYSGVRVIADENGEAIYLEGRCMLPPMHKGDTFPIIHDPNNHSCAVFDTIEEVDVTDGNRSK